MSFEYFTLFKMDTSHMPRKRFRLNASQREKLKTAIRNEERPSDIARDMGVSRRTVYDYKKQIEGIEEIQRSRVLTVRLQPKQLAHIDELAARIGKSRADTVRASLLRAADVFIPDPEMAAELKALNSHLSKIGTNLNQVARRLNDPHLSPEKRKLTGNDREQIREILRQINRIQRQVSQAASFQRLRNAEIFEALGAPDGSQEASPKPPLP